MKSHRFPLAAAAAAAAAVAVATVLVAVGVNCSRSPSEGTSPENGLASKGLAVGDASTKATQGQSATKRDNRNFNVTPLGRRAYAINQSFDAPQGDAAEVISRLLPAAKAGGAVAAFNIYLKVAACRNELDQARRNAPDTAPQGLISPECRSISPDGYSEYMHWLETSADQGYVPAQLLYSVDSKAIVGGAPQMLSDPEAVATYRRKAIRYLDQAAATGNVDALLALSSAYGNGVLTKRDPVKSYAYFLASETANPVALPPDMTQRARERFEQGMTRDEINRATSQGRRI